MNDFSIWFTEGLWHIADLKAHDHILFLCVLLAGYAPRDWKKILILVSAFTIGHSITLVLSVLNLVKVKTALVEFLIPCTIMFTALSNFIALRSGGNKNLWVKMMMVVFFGIIHGLGFSVLLKSLLGKTANITSPLLSFNLGIEAGQILIIAVIYLFTVLLTRLLGITSNTWRSFISSAAFGVAFIMAAERLSAII